MFMLDYTAEDSRIIATENPQTGENHCLTFAVKLLDNYSGKSHTLPSVTMQQLAELQFLAMLGDDSELAKLLYPKCEELLIGCPSECRPIP